MKRFTKISAALLCLSVLTACNQAEETTTATATAGTTEQLATVASEETVPSSEESQKVYSSNIDSQLELIADNFESVRYQYIMEDEFYPAAFIAVTDLNHNGRLEILLTSCMGSGAFSYTALFEISEDFSELTRIEYNRDEEDEESADFTQHVSGETNVAVYDCFKKDDVYYYLIEDYASAGWSAKHMGYFAWSFGDKINHDYIGGCSVNVQQDDTLDLWLYDTSLELFDSYESYEDYMNGYWSEYEKQPACEVTWVPFPDGNDVSSLLIESWNGFNPDSDKTSAVTYDYHEIFDPFYGDDYEYIIHEE